MYWLLNSENLGFKGNEKETINWKQRRNFKGDKGDNVIFFSFNQGQRFFTHVYIIDSAKSTPAGKDDKDREIKNIEVSLTLENEYNDKRIEDYLYSIPRIKYFDKYLYRHFNRKYYRLSKTEFNAIDKDEIFQSRTILGSALNSLHVEHRKAFAIHMVEHYPEVLQNNYDYDDILKLFYDYLEFAIIAPAKQFREAYFAISELIDPELIPAVAFVEEENKNNVDIIQLQAGIIAENIGFFQMALSVAQEDQLSYKESAFQNLFRYRPLPIDFNY